MGDAPPAGADGLWHLPGKIVSPTAPTEKLLNYFCESLSGTAPQPHVNVPRAPINLANLVPEQRVANERVPQSDRAYDTSRNLSIGLRTTS